MAAVLYKTAQSNGCVFASYKCPIDTVDGRVCRAPVVSAAEDGYISRAICPRDTPGRIVMEVVEVVCPDGEGVCAG